MILRHNAAKYVAHDLYTKEYIGLVGFKRDFATYEDAVAAAKAKWPGRSIDVRFAM